MTLPRERKRALKDVRRWLYSLLIPGPITKKEYRTVVRHILRHYPSNFEIDKYWKERGE